MNNKILTIAMVLIAAAVYADGPCGYRPYNYAYNPWREAQSYANRIRAAQGPDRSYMYSRGGGYANYVSTSSGRYVPNPSPAYVDGNTGRIRQVPVQVTQSAPIYPQQRVNTAYGQIVLPQPQIQQQATPGTTYVQPHYEYNVQNGRTYNTYVPGYYR